MRIAVVAAFNRFRLFHWLLAGFFLGAYLSGDDAETLHIWLGYGLVALLVWRLLIVPLRLRGFPQLLPPKGQRSKPGLSSVGKWLTVGALGSFAIASVVGLGMVDNGDVLAALPGVGPDVFGAASDIDFIGWMGDAEEVHEFFANLGLWLIGLHVGYVLLFRRKSVWPMLRGVPKAGPASTAPSASTSTPATTSVATAFASAPAPAAGEFTRLRIVSRQAETADSCSFTLQVPAAQRARFAAQPGQFLTLKVPAAEPALLRCYSLSQRPQADGALRITIKRVPGGRASNWLLDNLQAGDCIEALPPAGVFVPRNLDDDLLLLGAGSGITPLMAILQAALVEGSGQVRLFYASRDAASLIFAEELAEWSARYPDRLQLRIWLDAEQGVPSGPAIATKIADWSAADAFICGPQPFMDAAGAALGERGVDAARIHLERFAAAAPTAAPGGRRSRLRVALDGRRHELDVPRGEVLLEAMEQAGLQPPSACRSGVCAACKCRVVEGSVSMRSNQVLSESEVRQGWALACQAEPRSAELQVEY
ncbi:Flavohemoprotein [Pseudomonas aeruginosa]|jgi:3-ketosteroid 9alpha-monooxygenase subunit B|uniref:2Fe-2S iron-sulfur cluster-binding protein n=1 Tax=Pseudomonas TaxID=286 RepID=UPI00065B37F6|nr:MULTISPECIES: 2Fe-2S iron-sulfur cluster-binding protein [Pseudomonadaceae]KJS71851.2 MAG: ferredoxin:oxidoreductase FAD/NAD(P)-binding protein [[Pseudomonas] sp. BICA1-14]MBK3714859.1 Flavohemoprotein [Pseudomonas aeruginosa]MDG3651487.1 2Fe-2S iron-sulfur cluster-binding protein [Pseudomonas aeruginosa]CAD2265412.1 3-ketosteroid-9-alpha-monooxygenase, ferredoxin reductase component [Stutzerimonas stutzeri]